MKLTNIHIENFLGARAVDVSLTRPVTLICGANGSGKSSIRDAVALALTGDLSRVTLKKESGQLVSAGQKSARIDLAGDFGRHFATISSAGALKWGGDRGPSETLPFVLDGQRFAQLKPDERRAFLFGLMQIPTDGLAVIKRLAERGCDMARAEKVAPMLRSGFDAACAEAKNRTTQARGAWKAVTGETYGSEKAKTWRAPMPGAVAEGETTDVGLLKACEVALESWQREIGKLQAQQQRRGDLAAKLPALQEAAGRITRATGKLDADKGQMLDLEFSLNTTRQQAGAGPRVGLVHDLAALLAELIDIEGPQPGTQAWADKVFAAMAAYEREHGKLGATTGDPAARERLPALEQSHALLTRAIANDKRDIDAAQRAQVQADEITSELAQPLDAAALAEARQQVEQLKAERASITARLDAAASVKRATEAARQKTQDAAKHHADVVAWDLLADALAPGGIPAELLSEALGPINERLAQSANDAEWPRVGVESDMAITVGGEARAYSLCSESEQWRADAMLAEAIAHLSGLKLLVLDRFDVLDLQGRGDLIAWLDILAGDGGIDTALIFGTLKALPSQLPGSIAAHWIAYGACEYVDREALPEAA